MGGQMGGPMSVGPMGGQMGGPMSVGPMVGPMGGDMGALPSESIDERLFVVEEAVLGQGTPGVPPAQRITMLEMEYGAVLGRVEAIEYAAMEAGLI